MRSELTEKLKETYGDTINHHMYFEFNDGWYDIIVELFDALHNHTIDLEENDPLQFTTFKEKFGTLSIYSYGGDDVTRELIILAEKKSDHTCEECGKPGTIGGKSWYRTLCDEHKKNYE